MKILRTEKYFSTSGKLWAGTKGAIKKGSKGALIGAVLMPGKIKALKRGDYKTALQNAGVGAVVGGAVGGYLGYKKGVDEYKYNNDPEYRAKKDKELKEQIEKTTELAHKNDKGYITKLDYNSWVQLSKKLDVPQEFLQYVKFYKNIWSKKLDLWYSSMIKTGIKPYEIPQFKEYFPVPIEAEYCEDWFNSESDMLEDMADLYLATINDAGDDGFLAYNPKNKVYGWDITDGEGEKSLKTILLNRIKSEVEFNKEKLTKTQEQIIREFKTSISFLK